MTLWKWHNVDTNYSGSNNDPPKDACYLNYKGGFVGVTENPEVRSLMLDYLSGYDEGSQKRKRGEEWNERSERRRLVWQQSPQGWFSTLK